VPATRRAASQRSETTKQDKDVRTALRVPVPTLGMRVTDVHLPPLPGEDSVAKVRSALPTALNSALPSPLKLAFIAGLGVMGVLSILAWPAVLAVGVGVALTERTAREFLVHVQQQPAGPDNSASHQDDG